MTPKIIVTEGNSEGLLLSKLFSGIENIKIKAGSGYSSAVTLASSILTYHKKPVLLLLDAESSDQTDIAERYDFVKGYLSMSTPGAVFKIILFQPELETVFFEDAKVAEHLMGRPLTEPELKLARLHPKQVLQEAMPGNDVEMISKLNEDDIARLRQLAVVKEIKSFLQPENENLPSNG
jgi:hypothetical protein